MTTTRCPLASSRHTAPPLLYSPGCCWSRYACSPCAATPGDYWCAQCCCTWCRTRLNPASSRWNSTSNTATTFPALASSCSSPPGWAAWVRAGRRSSRRCSPGARLYVLLLALQTGSQVQIWSSAPLLRLNHVNQHPDSFRANEEMALHLAGVGALDSALAYSRRAGELSAQERPGDRQIRDIALHCLAGRAVPAALFDALGTVNPQRPFAVVSTMKGFATYAAA